MPLPFFFAAFLAEVAGTVAGFGSSTIFLPLALFFVDFKTALILVAILHIFGNIGRIAFFRSGFDKKLLLVFGIPSVLATFVGARLIESSSPQKLQIFLGIFLLIFSLSSLLKPNLRFQPTQKTAFLGGALSGFLAGLIGTGGALRGAFLTAFNLPKNIYIATAAAIALGVDLTRIPIYFSQGFLPPEFYPAIPILFFVAFAGSYTGKKIVHLLHQKTFRVLVLLALLAISLKFLYPVLNNF